MILVASVPARGLVGVLDPDVEATRRDRGYEYHVDEGSAHPVVPIDASHTGQIMHGMQWGRGLTQMIEINERLPVSTTTLSVAYMSNRTFFKRYAAIYGLSGTIGSTPETKLLSGLYLVQAWKVPPHVPKRLDVYSPRVVVDDRAWSEEILS